MLFFLVFLCYAAEMIIRLTAAAVAAFLIASPAQALVVKGNYHDRTLEICENRAGRACCRASVHQMRSENAKLKKDGEDCPYGKVPRSLTCPASLTWCGYPVKEDAVEFGYPDR
jgi:hypothetical protein